MKTYLMKIWVAVFILGGFIFLEVICRTYFATDIQKENEYLSDKISEIMKKDIVLRNEIMPSALKGKH